MNTSPIDGRMRALRAFGWCLGIAGVTATATYLTVTAWLVLTLARV
ncbi:MAG TPA: hypothetical protein VEX15_22990 [Nocardioidaceae bacterium]|nr:hypothetical protein [Nocardioidaceae bacterium]